MDVESNVNLEIEKTNEIMKVYNGITPYVGMEFSTADDAYNYYNSYAKDKGFGIRRESVDKSKKLDGRVLARTFVCNKAGTKRMIDKRHIGKVVHHRPDTRVGCIAKMKIKVSLSSTWIVAKFVEEHQNHILTSPDKVGNHYSHKPTHRSAHCKNIMGMMSEEGLPPSTIARVINVACGSQDERITPQQCTDHIRTLRKNNIGQECVSIIKNFQDKRKTDPDFYFAVEVDNFGTMRSVFWADGRSRSSYLTWGDVVVFDVTYRTNHLNLPFAPFTGVNHHRQSTLFGCALLADEQEETFVWLFSEWL